MTCFIYAIGSESGPIKVGISADPYVRLLRLQASCPHNIHLLDVRRFRHRAEAFKIEKHTHFFLSDQHLHHEWFDVNLDDCMHAIDLMTYGWPLPEEKR